MHDHCNSCGRYREVFDSTLAGGITFAFCEDCTMLNLDPTTDVQWHAVPNEEPEPSYRVSGRFYGRYVEGFGWRADR